MPPPSVIFLFLFLLLSSPLSLSLSLSLQPDCDTSPSSPSSGNGNSHRSFSTVPSPSTSTGFTSTLQSTLSQIQRIVSTISTFTGILGGDLRLSSAVSDCLDLLDLSSDELSLALNPRPATGNRHSDIKSWLSAALGNQDTCRDSLAGTSSLLASLIGTGLDSVTNMVAQSLSQIAGPNPNNNNRRKLLSSSSDSFPKWVSAADRKLLQAAAPTAPDVVVAADGTGNYKTVQEAVENAPQESAKRFVIYVKKGVYKENVEIKKKKWNIMLVGDGMDQTVISGSRNYIDHWTTYRSATVGELINL